jgi:hypothetical protein
MGRSDGVELGNQSEPHLLFTLLASRVVLAVECDALHRASFF